MARNSRSSTSTTFLILLVVSDRWKTYANVPTALCSEFSMLLLSTQICIEDERIIIRESIFYSTKSNYFIFSRNSCENHFAYLRLKLWIEIFVGNYRISAVDLRPCHTMRLKPSNSKIIRIDCSLLFCRSIENPT